MEKLEQKDYSKSGLISSIGCSVWWGLMPIYWHWIRAIDSWMIIIYRILLVAIVCFIAARFKFSLKEMIEPLKNKKTLIKVITAGILIASNWSIYIYLVTTDKVIESCIGYYIEPLMICLFGMIIFKEKLTKFKLIALIFAAIGIVSVVVYFGRFPALGLAICITFSVYAAVKKGLNLPPVLSLLYETVFLAPISLVLIIILEIKGVGALSQAPLGIYFLMYLCGLFTAFPLTLFANAANKVSMFILGLTEYISPTISLVLSILVFKEPFEPIQIIAFAFIWIGIIIFTIGEYKAYKITK